MTMASRASCNFVNRLITHSHRSTLSSGGVLFRGNANKFVPSLSSSCRFGSTIRVILTKDLPNGQGYAGEVQEVRAGFARNHLIPLKKALYATPLNFERVGIVDPALIQDQAAKDRQQLSSEEEEQLKAADLLRYYLRNKTLKIWRNVDDSGDSSKPSTHIHPGNVTHQHIREKLSKQLRIDLEDHEVVQLSSEPVPSLGDLEEESAMEKFLKTFPTLEDGTECPVEIKKLGSYVAKIHLGGGHSVGLRVSVLKR